jgi:hypothetical protein
MQVSKRTPVFAFGKGRCDHRRDLERAHDRCATSDAVPPVGHGRRAGCIARQPFNGGVIPDPEHEVPRPHARPPRQRPSGTILPGPLRTRSWHGRPPKVEWRLPLSRGPASAQVADSPAQPTEPRAYFSGLPGFGRPNGGDRAAELTEAVSCCDWLQNLHLGPHGATACRCDTRTASREACSER